MARAAALVDMLGPSITPVSIRQLEPIGIAVGANTGAWEGEGNGTPTGFGVVVSVPWVGAGTGVPAALQTPLNFPCVMSGHAPWAAAPLLSGSEDINPEV